MDQNENNDLKFKGNDPGAVRFGNFINYYSFYPPTERIERLPLNIWKTEQPSYCLDVGCNTGDLTKEFHQFLSKYGNANKILGVDIDPILIERARERNDTDMEFICLDIMSTDGFNFLKSYLNHLNLKRFHIVTCFSISMWIHLNHGDAGLRTFLELVSNLADLLVIEVQPWKCYRRAVKRMKKSKNSFPHFQLLKYRENIVEHVEDIIVTQCKRIKITESENTKWGRKTLFFR